MFKRFIALLLMRFFQMFPIKRNKIFFSSYQGTAYNNYPRMISELLHSLNSDFQIVWAIKDNASVPNYIKTVKPESLSEMFQLATSKFWVDNCRKYIWVRKKRKQVYFQTWHGPVCIKSVEKDATELDDYYVKRAINDSKMANYILSQCEWRTKNILNSFWYEGSLIKGDTEIFQDKNVKELNQKIKTFYNLNNKTRIVLYAPTFRNGNDLSPYNIDFENLLLALRSKFGGEWCVLFRLHPNIASLFKFSQNNVSVLNGNLYEKMEELIVASDILISDYSGCIFSALKAEKIVFIYASDLEKYVSKERKLYFDIKNLPAPLAENQQQLVDNIKNFEYDSYLKQVKTFNDGIGYYSNDGIEEICYTIINIYKENG